MWVRVSYYADGLLLWIAFSILITGFLARFIFFLSALVSGYRRMQNRSSLMNRILTGVRVILPFHRGVLKKPFYAVLRYVFHACLLIVPIWFYGHIELWDASRFRWYWTPLPDAWADWMTLILLFLCAFFILRRLILPDVRRHSSVKDFAVIGMAILPFLSGYLLTHGTLEDMAFFGDYDNMLALHILSGELMMVLAVFLFCTTRLKEDRCTGCAACEENCPTGTLAYHDKGGLRTITYSHYQCICCGSCVYVCPENAAELRHDIHFKKFFQIFSRNRIREVGLAKCKRCGVFFFPAPQMIKIESILSEIKHDGDFLHLCSRCRQHNVGKLPGMREISIARDAENEVLAHENRGPGLSHKFPRHGGMF